VPDNTGSFPGEIGAVGLISMRPESDPILGNKLLTQLKLIPFVYSGKDKPKDAASLRLTIAVSVWVAPPNQLTIPAVSVCSGAS